MRAPKLFVSYSWSSTDREAWVVQLSTELHESGVDVVLDKWDLKEGHDSHAFMEKMVTDPEIKKVILVCDQAYVEKANRRSGGVGTEAQIISGEIYQKQDQEKFVAVVVERDDEGKPCVPAYYKSRIFVDLSDPSAYSENFERLLRWIFDRPLYVKPELGDPPSFLTDDVNAVVLTTSSRFKRALEAIRANKDHAIPATVEYFDMLAEQFERLRIRSDSDPFDEAVVRSIEGFLPYRDQAINIFLGLALYLDSSEARRAIHRFFERLIPYMSRPEQVTSWREWDSDNFKFIVHELFLYAIATLVRYERFESADYLMSTEYYIAGRSDYGRDAMVSFEIFRQHMKSLEYRNERLEAKRLSLRADLLQNRAKGIAVEFRHLMQADFILFMRDNLHRPGTQWHWWPETLLYASRQAGAFEVFARSRSARYFDKAKVLLGIDSKEALQPLLGTFATGVIVIPRWQFESFGPTHLLGYQELATKP